MREEKEEGDLFVMKNKGFYYEYCPKCVWKYNRPQYFSIINYHPNPDGTYIVIAKCSTCGSVISINNYKPKK